MGSTSRKKSSLNQSVVRSSSPPRPRDPPAFIVSPRMLKTAVLAGLVAGAAAVVPSTWCNSAPPSGWDVCNPSLSLDVRSADIVSRLSIADKIKALGTGTPALSSINLPQYKQVREPNPSIVTHDASSNRLGLARPSPPFAAGGRRRRTGSRTRTTARPRRGRPTRSCRSRRAARSTAPCGTRRATRSAARRARSRTSVTRTRPTGRRSSTSCATRGA